MSRIWIYQTTVFLSAFLFFQIQPMTSKALLPLFGGSYLVWGVCMVFYQAVLLLGYLYAHSVHRRFGVVLYSKIHWILLLLPILVVSRQFIMPETGMGQMHLAVSIVVTLTLTVGLPVFVLSTTSLMLQKSLLSSDLPERMNPYVLYSGSNLGSMLGLLTYPALVEPFLNLDSQWHLWLAGYLCVVCLHAFCMPTRKEENLPAAQAGGSVRPGLLVCWFILSAAGTALLLAVTNVITLDLASIPFLWILPLAIYLLAYVVTFKEKPWYPAWWPKIMYWAVVLGILLYLMIQIRLTLPILVSLGLYMFILFAVCLTCSGELVRSKPADTNRNLTTFYLTIAAGGLAGSLFIGWVIPLVSRSLVEFPLALVLAVVSFALCFKEHEPATGPDGRSGWIRTLTSLAICSLIIVLASTLLPALIVPAGTTAGKEPLLMVIMAVPVILAVLWAAGKPWQFVVLLIVASISLGFTEDVISRGSRIGRFRNFYGIYKVYDSGNLRYLQHGTTLHGRQYISGPKVGVPLSYHHPSGPAGAMLVSTNFSFHHVGMIGLGTGALSAYFGNGQTFTIFELDPDNVPIAERDFVYLKTARNRGAKVRFMTGDGRISLRKLKESDLDLLLIDAFNSGSIPVHLLTVEALQEYFRVLGDDGLLLMHVSNRFIDLPPVICSNAKMLGLNFCEKSNAGLVDPDADTTQWVALSRNPSKIDMLIVRMGWSDTRKEAGNLPKPWTDRYSNVLGSLMNLNAGLHGSL
ncbi:MAG: hypothetical protein PHR77_05205 [Kiritimatiellae bacterium]|nr:hypothetical protein [Kiritimatiellia bacterium]